MDPRVLDRVDRQARQILVIFGEGGDNAMLQLSLLDLKDKTNRIIIEINDTTRLELANVESVTKTPNNFLLVLVNSKEMANWLRKPDVEDKFTSKLIEGAYFCKRSYTTLLQ